MPSKKTPKAPLPPIVPLPQEAAQWLDQVVTGPMTAEGVEDVMRSFKKALIERALKAEMSLHLGYSAGDDKPASITARCRMTDVTPKVPHHARKRTRRLTAWHRADSPPRAHPD